MYGNGTYQIQTVDCSSGKKDKEEDGGRRNLNTFLKIQLERKEWTECRKRKEGKREGRGRAGERKRHLNKP